MTEISVLDLQNLRHLIGGFETTHCKMQDYAQESQDRRLSSSSRSLRSLQWKVSSS